MADNVALPPSGANAAADEVTYSGDTTKVQIVRLVHVSGTEGSKTLSEIADGTNGLLVNLGANNDVTVTSGTVTANLAAGTNNIGDVDVLSVVPGTGTTNLGKAEDAAHTSGDTGVMALGVSNDANSAFGADGDYVPLATDTEGNQRNIGNRAHDAVDSGAPVKIGAKAIAHGTNPTAVAAADRTDLYANRAGVLFTIGGHPNVITRSFRIVDADGPQTDASMVGTIAPGTKVVVTAIAATVDSATTATGGVAVRMGFGATIVPAAAAAGVNGVLLDHPGIAAGSGIVVGNGAGILGVGADGEELRFSCEDPVGGALAVTFSYYTIES